MKITNGVRRGLGMMTFETRKDERSELHLSWHENH